MRYTVVENRSPTSDFHTKVIQTSGVARISKLGGTPVTWPEGPMRGGVFGEGQRSGPPPHQLGELSLPPSPPPKNLLVFARILLPCLSTVGGGAYASLYPPPRGYATDPDLPWSCQRSVCQCCGIYRWKSKRTNEPKRNYIVNPDTSKIYKCNRLILHGDDRNSLLNLRFYCVLRVCLTQQQAITSTLLRPLSWNRCLSTLCL